MLVTSLALRQWFSKSGLLQPKIHTNNNVTVTKPATVDQHEVVEEELEAEAGRTQLALELSAAVGVSSANMEAIVAAELATLWPDVNVQKLLEYDVDDERACVKHA
eukprot:3107573-Pyramimonas_sp.AAC.2